MAEEKKLKNDDNPLIGSIAKPTTLDRTTKIDIDTEKCLIDNIIDTAIFGGLNVGALENFTSVSNARSQIYSLIDTMAEDASVSAILKTYAEEVCEISDSGHIVWCESSNSDASRFINYLLNVMNVDKHIYTWVYCLLKYGDVYLKLYRESDYDDKLFNKDKIKAAETGKMALHENIDSSIDESININLRKNDDRYSYYVEMVSDPSTMFELTKYGRTYGYVETPNNENVNTYLNSYITGTTSTTSENISLVNYQMKSNDVNIYQADEYVHAFLDDNFSRFPEKVEIFTTEEDYNNKLNAQSYAVKRGKSILIDAYKTWREKTLLENAILLNRLTKSSVVRNIQVEVGDMPKSQVQNTLRRIKELFEQKAAIDVGNGMVEYNNPGPIENNIFTATHNGQGAITVNAVGGDIEVKNLGDLDEWVNKFYAAFGIPKQYYGYTEDGAGFNGGTSLAIISSVFAKSVKRVQNAILQALTDAINLFLLNRGCKNYINNFVLKMKAPLTQEEKDYREDLSNRISAISNMQSLFADIEDKSNKLKILKTLIGTLNYGDEILSIIQEEIDAADAEKAKTEAEANENEESSANVETEEDNNDSNIDMSDLDLGSSAEAPIAEESFFNKTDNEQLLENNQFVGEYITEDSDLPSPEEIDDVEDFTKNK